MGPNSGYNNPHFTSYISRSVVHRYAKPASINSFELFIPQTRMGWICSESFELLPELNSNFFR